MGKKQVLNVPMPPGHGLVPATVRFLHPLIERLLSLPTLNRWYNESAAMSPETHFADRVLMNMGITVEFSERRLAKIPKKGPVVVVANHPLGGIEGVVMISVMRRIRPDVRVMANYVLGALVAMRPDFLLVDPFDTSESARKNLATMRDALKWASRHLFGVFPAGEVAAYSLKKRRIEERPWDPTVGRIIRRARAPVVPVFVEGANGPLFQAAGLIHPILRTLLLCREYVARQDRPIRLRIGEPIPFEELSGMEDPARLIAHLRDVTLALGR